MMKQIIVCSFNEDFVRSIQGEALVVRTDDEHAVEHINRVVNEQNKLHCIHLIQRGILSGMHFPEEWAGIPIHFYIPKFGRFKEFVSKINTVRDLSIRIFLSSAYSENFQYLQVMSSLGVDCGIYFDQGTIDWDEMNDLMHWSVYSKVFHAEVEPFHWLFANYKPNERIDFGSVYFENPKRYIHINEEGKVALTPNKLLQGEFIQDKYDHKLLIESEAYNKYLVQWQEYFLEQDGCAYCPAWRICLGKFSHTINENPGCKQFFKDMLDAADFYFSNNKNVTDKELCQL